MSVGFLSHYICHLIQFADVLAGSCKAGQNCEHYHDNLPYRWLYAGSSSGSTMTPFPSGINDELERHFCMAEKDGCTFAMTRKTLV